MIKYKIPDQFRFDNNFSNSDTFDNKMEREKIKLMNYRRQFLEVSFKRLITLFIKHEAYPEILISH